jgi:hypothetical protein
LGIYYANEIGTTRQDTYLLPWNLEETEMIKKASKKKMEKERQKDKTLLRFTHQAKSSELVDG